MRSSRVARRQPADPAGARRSTGRGARVGAARPWARSSSTSCAAPPNSTSPWRSTSPGAPAGPSPRKAEHARRESPACGERAPARSRKVRRAEAKRRRVQDHQHWFEPIAEHLGSAYLRYSFTKGTCRRSTSSSRRSACGGGSRPRRRLRAGSARARTGTPRCGGARHRHQPAVHRSGQRPLPRLGATFERLDARSMRVRQRVRRGDLPVPGSVRADDGGRRDDLVLAGIAAALKPGGAWRLRRSAPTSRSSTTTRRPSTRPPESATSAPKSATSRA